MWSTKRRAAFVAVLGLVLFFSIVICREAAAQQRVPHLVTALLQFERNVTWDAVSPDWAASRDNWVATVHAALVPAEVAVQILALEDSMSWDSVEPSWRDQRPNWLIEMQAAQSDGEVARGLLDLERATLWTAVAPEWRQLRDAWVAGLESIQ